MDSLTHIVLGAAVGEVALGRKEGNRAMLWGSIAGSLPDFDAAFTWLFSPVDGLFVHRGFSHSIFFALLISPALGYIIHRLYGKNKQTGIWQWTLLSFMAIMSHNLIDCFNTYGTELLAPFSNKRLAFDSIGIIDFSLLLTLSVLVLLMLLHNRSNKNRRVYAYTALTFTVLFTVFTVINKNWIEESVKKQLNSEGIEYIRLKTSPLPITNFLWLVLVEDSNGYHYGYRSSFDRGSTEFEYIKRNEDALAEMEGDKEIEKLIRFTNSFYSVAEINKTKYQLFDLRYGSMAFDEENWFVFTFDIEKNQEGIKISRSHPNRSFNTKNMKKYFSRIFLKDNHR
jgi:inner membrane protein